jgi:subtilisin family serine protease
MTPTVRQILVTVRARQEGRKEGEMAQRKIRAMAAWMVAVVLLLSALPARPALAGSPKDAEFYKLQWNLKAIHAHPVFSNDAEANAKSSALVAIVDTGIDYLHPNLDGLVDLEHSTSLVRRDPSCLYNGAAEPGTPYRPQADGFDESVVGSDGRLSDGRLPFTDYHSHGTAVAGLISSTGTLLAGVTAGTRLLAVKVHGISRQNCLSVYLAGIDYAVAHGADVIHLSFPLEFPRSNTAAVNRVNDTLDRAHDAGAVLVAAAGNGAVPQVVGDPARSTMFRFCEGNHVICVSATGPANPAQVEEPFWDASAAYTFYGPAIDVAGPGGTGLFPSQIVPVWLTCSQVSRVTTGAAAACRSQPPEEPREIWPSTGTSFAAAATSGLAALMVGLTGIHDPDRIEQLIEDSADDLGEPGVDEYYGAGRINVKQAVQAVAAATP